MLIQYSSESTAGVCTTDILEADSYQYTGYGCYSYAVAPDTYGTTYSSGPSAANYTVTLLNAVYSPAPTPTPTTPSTSTTSTPTTSPTAPLISPTPPPSHTSSVSVNIGPIAGGVVGGVAALAIIALLVFFLVRNNKKQTGPAAVMPSTTEQHQWQTRLAQPPSQHQPQQYGNNSWPQSQQDYPPSNDTDKPLFASHTSQLQSPISQQSVSDPMSYTPDSAQERHSTFAPPYMAAGDSQMSGNQPIPELDGQAHNGNQRY